MRILILASFFVLSSFLCFSQPGIGDPPSDEIPITDHIEILVVACLLLGAYAIIRQKSKIKKSSERTN